MKRRARDITIVVLTHERRDEVLRTVSRLLAAHDGLPVVVVDNGSTDGTEAALAARFPTVRRVRLARNQGAAGRNAGVRTAATPYVAFCDDDVWWDEGALARAAAFFDAYPRLAVATARVLVGEAGREDPACAYMARCGRVDPAVPGLEVAGFLAGACVMRRTAFMAAGGYEARLFIGGEESLLALDLLAAGWRIAYVPELVAHHHPSSHRDAGRRRLLLLRNALWCAWLRRPAAAAWRETRERLGAARGLGLRAQSLAAALAGLPWVLRHRRVLPPHVEAALHRLDPERGRL